MIRQRGEITDGSGDIISHTVGGEDTVRRKGINRSRTEPTESISRGGVGVSREYSLYRTWGRERGGDCCICSLSSSFPSPHPSLPSIEAPLPHPLGQLFAKREESRMDHYFFTSQFLFHRDCTNPLRERGLFIDYRTPRKFLQLP